MRHTDVERHWLYPVPCHCLTEQNVAHDRTITMDKNELGVEQHQRQKRLCECGSNFCLLMTSPANSFGVGCISANRN